MKFFKLPDLGEGLAEAEIVEWKVSAGDTVSVDQVLLSVETAKALVDVPSPVAGVIARLCGAEGTSFTSVRRWWSSKAVKMTAPSSARSMPISSTSRITSWWEPLPRRCPGAGHAGTVRLLAQKLGLDIERLRGAAVPAW